MSLIENSKDYPYGWYIRPILAAIHRTRGRVPEPVKQWARMPLVFFGFQIMLRVLERKSSPLDPKLRALVRTRIAQLNHCHFCIDLNSAHALDRGVSQEKIDELACFRSSSLFSDAEKSALEYAEAITATAIELDPLMADRLRKSFSDDAIIELAAVISHQNMSAKFNAALGIAAEGYCPTAYRPGSSN
jgi:AhpD family alkylhydroperoxidase